MAVVDFPGITRLDIPPEKALENASAAGLKTALVIGWTADEEFYFYSSAADGGDVLWLLELAKKHLLEAATE